MALLDVKNLTYAYPDGTMALRGIDLTINETDRLALVGANGGGKSTLLIHLSGCLTPPPESLWLNGIEIGRHNVGDLRAATGLIFQNPDDQLFMPTVLEDVGFGLIARGLSRAEANQSAQSVLESLNAFSLANRSPHRLSGGEKRVVALAGILIMKPQLLLLDEPSAALDPRARRLLIERLDTLSQPMVLSTHDLDMALDLCNRVAIISAGKVVATGGADVLRDGAALRHWGLEPLFGLGR